MWKIVLSVAVLYECLLLFILSLTPAKAREFMKFFDENLGVSLLYRDYASDCRIYIPENPDHFKNVKGVFGDIFILAHFLGWIWKSFIFRDWSVLWVLSVWFEDLEVTAQHILPNFQESRNRSFSTAAGIQTVVMQVLQLFLFLLLSELQLQYLKY